MGFILIAAALSRENWPFPEKNQPRRAPRPPAAPPPAGPPGLLFQFGFDSGINIQNFRPGAGSVVACPDGETGWRSCFPNRVIAANRPRLSPGLSIEETVSIRHCAGALFTLSLRGASAAEVQSHLYIALDRKYIDQETFDEIYRQADKTAAIISGLIRYLRGNASKPRPKQT